VHGLLAKSSATAYWAATNISNDIPTNMGEGTLEWSAVRVLWLSHARRTVLCRAAPFESASLHTPTPPAGDEIRTDLDRSGAATLGIRGCNHVASHREGVRSVLQAWCALRPDIGYCQGMNILAGATVCVAGNAPDGFALYALLLSRLPAGGVVLEVGALWHLLTTRAPKRFGRRSKAAAPLREAVGLVALQWLCPLWAGVFPLSRLVSAWAIALGDDSMGGAAVAAGGPSPESATRRLGGTASGAGWSLSGGNLRIALALIEGVDARELHRAALADGAAGDCGGGQAYNVLRRRAAEMGERDVATLLRTARGIMLSGAEVVRARAVSAAELEARVAERAALIAARRPSAQPVVGASSSSAGSGRRDYAAAYVASSWRSGLFC